MDSYCQANPKAIKVDHNNCAKYFNCSDNSTLTGHMKECKYPDLFSSTSLTCASFETVNCDTRTEPKAPCK